MSAAKKRVAILGGGMGSLAAAFSLTSQPGAKDLYDITVYQMGWRLGGKGASGRNAGDHQRIEEHGLHIWLGFYDNAFDVIKECYAEMARPLGAPLATWDEAFKKHDLVALEENIGGVWKNWFFDFPENSLVPGKSPGAPLVPTMWSYVRRTIRFMHEHFSASLFARERCAAPDAEQTARTPMRSRSLLGRIFDDVVRDAEEIFRDIEACGLCVEHAALRCAVALAESLDDDAGRHAPEHHQALMDLLKEFIEWLWKEVEPRIAQDDAARRLFIILDLAFLNAWGMLKYDVIFKGLDVLDGWDYIEWLRDLGAPDITLTSAPIRGFYDLVFAFEGGDPQKPNFAASVALRSAMHVVFDYKGAIFWKMQAGMGDTVFTPLHDALAKRGVKFEFFHKVENLALSLDGASIASIAIGRQVWLRDQRVGKEIDPTVKYDPFVPVNGLPCWPSEPLYDQIDPDEAKELRARGIDLESYYSDYDPVERRTLTCGTDFDVVVLGIPPAAHPWICSELIAKRPDWAAMVSGVKTVQTQGMQLWLAPDLAALGWQGKSPVMDAYADSQNTWADMSQLICREVWPASNVPGNVSYFCGPLLDADPPPPMRPSDFPKRMRRIVESTSLEWLEKHIGFLWPLAVDPKNPAGLDWSKLVAPAGTTGVARAKAQYYRANVEPSERYVLSVKNASALRIRNTGIANLFVAGDWTLNGFNAGCIEAATMSGMQVAEDISGNELAIAWEGDGVSTRTP